MARDPKKQKETDDKREYSYWRPDLCKLSRKADRMLKTFEPEGEEDE